MKNTKEVPATKEVKAVPFSNVMDSIILKGGTWEQIVSQIQKEADARGTKTKFNTGRVKAHIRFRTKQNADWLKENKVAETQEGIKVSAKKVSKPRTVKMTKAEKAAQKSVEERASERLAEKG